MKRRQFILLLLSTTLGLPANAQTVPLIGFLNSGSPDAFSGTVEAFREGLVQAGYIVGTNVHIEYRWAEGQYDHLPTFAAELLNRGISVLVATGGPPAALAAKNATKSVPIVFTSGADPVKVGLVSSVSRPGSNITGISLFTAVLASKRLELWRELLPQARKIALLVNGESPTAQVQVSDIEETARELSPEVFIASTASELTETFVKLGSARTDALFVTSDPFFFSQRNLITELAARYSIPAIYEGREYVEAGGLISYGTAIRDGYRQAGVYTGRILRGEKPADIPVQQPTKFELVVNLKTAKALGLTIPPSLLARADEVIE